MLRRVVFVLVVCSCVGIAFGAATKIRWFDVISPDENPEADGMAILNYVAGQNETMLQLVVSDFTENATYDVVVRDGDRASPLLHGLHTDQHGNGTVHWTIPAIAGDGDWTNADVEIWFVFSEFPEDDLAAVGSNPNT